MCVIVYLRKDQSIPYDMLENAVNNNWHSYGIVTKIDGKLDIKKKVPESGEVDAKEVFDLLEKDKQYERYLHLRHNTAGATNEENTHPFEIFFDGKTGRHVVFMHNGTMHPYVSKRTTEKGTVEDDPDGASDTKNFVDKVLIPYLSSMDFGNGPADIENNLTKLFIQKFWSSGNRGILISSDQASLLVDSWKKVGPKDDEILASNDTYFEKVIRGPELTRRAVREAIEKKEMSGVAKDYFAKLADYNFDTKHGYFTLTESLKNIFGDWDVWDRSGTVALGYATRTELESLHTDREACLTIMDYVFTDYASLYKESQDLEDHIDILEEKLSKATKHIATMSVELKDLKSQKKEAA